MAARIDRVEREFILKSAADSRTAFRFHAAGRTGRALLSSFDSDNLRFEPAAGEASSFVAGERVSVLFDLHGQDFAFGGVIWKSSPLELRSSEALYRGLDRRWPRIPEPSGLRAEILFESGASPKGYPLSADYSEVEPPDDGGRLEVGSLDGMVESFRDLSSKLASKSRLRMVRKGQSAEDPGEEITSKLGRLLFVPTTWAASLPGVDPWSDGRLITEEIAENYEGIASLDGSSPLRRHISARDEAGITSFLVSPVLYYRSVVAFVHVENGRERPRPLEREVLELAWSFSRNLAWFLKRHSYFKGREGPRAEIAKVLDASPTGLQVLLGPEAPLLRPGAQFEMKLHFPKGRLPCKARVTRRTDGEGRCRYGLSIEGLSPSTIEALAQGFYGRDFDQGKRV